MGEAVIIHTSGETSLNVNEKSKVLEESKEPS